VKALSLSFSGTNMQTSTHIKLFIEAKTKKELVNKMLENNMKRGAYLRYDIVKDGKNWTAWFETDIKHEILKRVTDVK